MDSVSSRLWFTTPIGKHVFRATAVVVAAMSYFVSVVQDLPTKYKTHPMKLAAYCLNVK